MVHARANELHSNDKQKKITAKLPSHMFLGLFPVFLVRWLVWSHATFSGPSLVQHWQGDKVVQFVPVSDW